LNIAPESRSQCWETCARPQCWMDLRAAKWKSASRSSNRRLVGTSS